MSVEDSKLEIQEEEEVEDPDTGFVLNFEKDIIVTLPGAEEEEEEEEIEAKSSINVQVAIKQDDDDELQEVRLRFLSKDEIHFLYEEIFTEEKFEELKSDQDLEIEFSDFPNVLEDILQHYEEEDEDEEYKAQFTLNDDQTVATLVLQQDLDLCTIDIFRFELNKCEVKRIQRISQERYNELCKKVEEMNMKYHDMLKRVKRQCPKIADSLRA